MPRYVVTYHGAGSPSPEEAPAAMAAFKAWMDANATLVLDGGAPVTTVSAVGGEPAAEIGGYSILEGSLEDFTAALEAHPFVARGGTLQLNEAMTLRPMD